MDTSAIQKVEKEDEEEEENTEMGKEEMIQWALRALERTQYLSDLESEEEEYPPPSSHPGHSSSTVGASNNQASASCQESSETRHIEEDSDGEAATSDFRVLATSETGLNHAGLSTSATHVVPTEDPLAVPIKVEEPAPCNNNCVRMGNTSDGVVELKTCAVKAETSSPESLPACLQKLALPTGQVSNELTSGTNTDVARREEASGSIIAGCSGSSSAQLLDVCIKQEPDARLCYTPAVCEELLEDPLAPPTKTELTVKKEERDEVVSTESNIPDPYPPQQIPVKAEVVSPDSLPPCIRHLTVKTESVSEAKIFGDLESLGVPGSRRSPLRESAFSACDLLNQRPVQERRSVNMTVPFVVSDSDSDEAMDVDTVDQNCPGEEGLATQDSPSNIPVLRNHPCTAQQRTSNSVQVEDTKVSKSMKEEGHKMENMSSFNSVSNMLSAQPSTTSLCVGDSQHGASDYVPHNACHRATHNDSRSIISSHSTSHNISHRVASPFVLQDPYTGATFMVSPLSGPISVPQRNGNLPSPISVLQENSNLTGPISVPQGNSILTRPISVPQGNSNLTDPMSVPEGNSNMTSPIIATHQNIGSGDPVCVPQSNTGPQSGSFKIISGTQVTPPLNYTQQPPRSDGPLFMPDTLTTAPNNNLSFEPLPQERPTDVGKEGSNNDLLNLLIESCYQVLQNMQSTSTASTPPNSVCAGRAQNSGRTTQNVHKSTHQSAEQSSLDSDPPAIELNDDGKNKNTALRSGILMCNNCDKTFSSHRTLTRHMKTHFIGGNCKSSDSDHTQLKVPNGPNKRATDGDSNKRFEGKYHLRERSKRKNLSTAVVGDDDDDVTSDSDFSDDDSEYRAESESSDDDSDDRAKSDTDEDVSSDEGFYECTGCKKKFLSRYKML